MVRRVGSNLVALVLIVLGVALVVFSFYEAFLAYTNYRPVMPKVEGDLAKAVSSASFELINLAARLAFIGVMVWAGSVVLRNGIDLLKAGERKEENSPV